MLLYSKLSYDVVGACMKVHTGLGCGFMEKVYQEALAIQLYEAGIPFEREKPIHIYYHGNELSCSYIPDFIIDNKMILEIKAVKEIDDIHKAQTINYLRATKLQVGYIVNFGETRLHTERLVNFKK